tara:strand:- start:372 stop:1199 length:828 start_codon:yes stop_codon:yes gene_type:complete
MRYIVTGSTGFIGRNTVKALLESGNQVEAITTNSAIPSNILDCINGSKLHLVRSLSSIPRSLLNSSTIIHCAWNNVQNIQDNSHFDHIAQQIDFLNLVAKSNAKKLLITGTCYEFGMKQGPMSVRDETAPNTPYAKAKEIVHQKALEIICKDTNIDFTWARLFYTYGKGQHLLSFYTQLMAAIKSNEEFFNMSSGKQLYDYMEVGEVANALCQAAMKKCPKIIHICNGHPVSLRNLAEEIIADQNSALKLNLGHFPDRAQASIALWGAESFSSQI